MTVDVETLQRVAIATCRQMHDNHVNDGYLQRPTPWLRDTYRRSIVWPVIYAALDAGVIEEVQR
jgi:hypothetical protein